MTFIYSPWKRKARKKRRDLRKKAFSSTREGGKKERGSILSLLEGEKGGVALIKKREEGESTALLPGSLYLAKGRGEKKGKRKVRISRPTSLKGRGAGSYSAKNEKVE